MATVGEKRGPRLPMGPKPNEVADLYKDDVELGEVVEAPKVVDVEGAPLTSAAHAAAITVAPGEVVEGDFKELKRPKVPLPPAKTINPPDVQLFYKWYASLTPEHLAQIICYMYRTHPVIDRKPPKTKYIDCFSSPIDDQWVLENHGTGNYMVIVNDSGLDKKTRTITTVYIRVQNPIYPPKINMYDLDTNHPDNKVYAERCIIEGKLKGDKTPMSESPMVSGGGGSGNDALVMLLDKMISRMDRQQFANAKDPKDDAIAAAFQIIGKGHEASTKMMLDNMREQDPSKLLTLITSIVEMTKQPQQPQGSGMGDMLKLMELMDKRAESNMQLMKTMFEGNNAEKTDDDGLDKFLDRITKLQELGGLFGGGNGGKKGTLETVLEYGMPVLGSIAQAAQSFFAMRAGMAPQPNATDPNNPNAVPQNATSQVPNKPMQVAAPQQQSRPQSVKEAMLNQNQEQQMMMEMQIRNGLKQLTPMLVVALQRKNDDGGNFDGSQFAEGIDNTYGSDAYDMIASLGKAKMLEYMRADKDSWAVLAPFEARLDKFVDEFLDYGKPDAAAPLTDAPPVGTNAPATSAPVSTVSREDQEAVFDISGAGKKKPKGGK